MRSAEDPASSPGRKKASTKRSTRSRIDPARLAAYDLLRAVDRDDAYANLVLPPLLRERHISERDAAFATELAYGTLRWQGLYDHILAPLISRPIAELDSGIIEVLRLGCHQLLKMRVPSHAAVGTSVDLARTVLTAGPVGLINAVLRKVAAGSPDELIAAAVESAPGMTRDSALAVRWSHPEWVVTALRDALGTDPGNIEGLLEANNHSAAVTVVARPGRGDRDELVRQGAEPTKWSPWGATLRGGNPAEISAIREGRAAVQDEGSQLVTLAVALAPLAESLAVAPTRRWLDLCAGPGGKASVLAGLAESVGATLTANELHPHRAELVRRALSGASAHHEVVVGDGRSTSWPPASFDRVLVDAPCTGLGALRRRPEARWRRQPRDVAGLVTLQGELLSAAIDAAAVGGVIGYVTCSPHRAETVGVVSTMLQQRSDIEAIDARALLPDVPELGAGPWVQLWPHIHGTDAMFCALLRRTG